MTPDPKALAVLLDAARACYGDDSEQVRWLLNPDAVRQLMKIAPTFTPEFHDEREQCSTCRAEVGEAHDKGCVTAAAWRALGDPRGAADIERAETEAWRHHVGRADWDPSLGRCLTDEERRRLGPAALRPVNGANPGDLVEVAVEPTGMRMLGPVARLIGAAANAIADHADGRFRLASESQQAAQYRRDVAELDRFTGPQAHHPAQYRCLELRRDSDARGMEAVEDEAHREDLARDAEQRA